MSQRRAVTKTTAARYKRSKWGAKKIILDELCAITPVASRPCPQGAARGKLDSRGRSHTKPGSLLKDSIPMPTWADWDDDRPGFVEIDLVGHERGNNKGDFCFTLDVTDIATGWTETRSVKNKGRQVGICCTSSVK